MGTLGPVFPVVDIFYSLQGEGSLAGVPAVFIRLAGCPVNCPWCDTRDAWSAEGSVKFAVCEIVERVRPFGCRHVIVTGGEPLIHRHVARLIDALGRDGCHVTLETAAVAYRKFNCNLISISPKLPGTLGSATATKTFRPDIIRRLIGQGEDYQLKFVVQTYAHVREVLAACEKMPFVDRARVQLMPRSEDRAQYLKTAPKVARWAIKHRLAFSPRLHLVLEIT